MVFASHEFILYFLPICIIGYFLTYKIKGAKASRLVILLASIISYSIYNVFALLILMINTVITYIAIRLIIGNKHKKAVCIGIVIFQIAVLIFFKYYGFFLKPGNGLINPENIIIPLGIGFYILQQIACIIDVYRGEAKDFNLIDYFAFSFFFPTIASGPIIYYNEYSDWLGNVDSYHVNYDNMCAGFQIFCLGLAKKVLIADMLASAVSKGYDIIYEFETTNSILLALCYSLQLYFDFTGYCDMSFGVAKMLNFELPLNFDSPYKSFNIGEFWDRWHMTLTRFFTKYVYFPLGGSRKGTLRTYVNIMIVFIVSGFWHGTGINYIIWGVMNGVAMIIYRLFRKMIDKWHPAVNWFITFAFFTSSLVYFGAPSVEKANRVMIKSFSFNFDPINPEFASMFNVFEINKLLGMLNIFITDLRLSRIMFVCMIALIFVILCFKNNIRRCLETKPGVLRSVVCAMLLVLSMCSMTGKISFVYAMF